MALKLAIVRVRDDNGKVDELTLPDGKTIPAVLFDADLGNVLADAVRSFEQTRPGARAPGRGEGDGASTPPELARELARARGLQQLGLEHPREPLNGRLHR